MNEEALLCAMHSSYHGLLPSQRGLLTQMRFYATHRSSWPCCQSKDKTGYKKTIERGDMKEVHGIIVHQTGGATAQSAINSYRRPSAKGAHFLIDKNGSIYQAASLYKQTWHVGKLKARCLLEMRCSPVEVRLLQKFNPTQKDKREMLKKVPERFPSNLDSILLSWSGKPFREA